VIDDAHLGQTRVITRGHRRRIVGRGVASFQHFAASVTSILDFHPPDPTAISTDRRGEPALGDL
jgi:hypothetical protein